MTLLNLLILNVLLYIHFTHSLMCKNENNESVDWYVLYKLPSEHTSNSLIKNGVAYLYITSNDEKIQWKSSKISINNSESIPGLTLKPYYEKQTSMHIFYNDEPPSGAKNDHLGHTKGVIMSNETTGFWLIHSVPHYPPENIYSYPDSGIRNGQSFLCISFNLENINNIGKQMQFNQPNVYKTYITEILQKKLPNINAVINSQYIKTAPWYQLKSIYSLNGIQFLSFAKSRQFGKEIYKDWIAIALKTNLLVETWLNGAGKLPSDCTRVYRVNNIKNIRAMNDTVVFASSKDHSKWAVSNSKSNSTQWICIGDINREEHQKQRGGGSVCISNLQLWNEYNRIIAEIECCENDI